MGTDSFLTPTILLEESSFRQKKGLLEENWKSLNKSIWQEKEGQMARRQ